MITALCVHANILQYRDINNSQWVHHYNLPNEFSSRERCSGNVFTLCCCCCCCNNAREIVVCVLSLIIWSTIINFYWIRCVNIPAHMCVTMVVGCLRYKYADFRNSNQIQSIALVTLSHTQNQFPLLNVTLSTNTHHTHTHTIHQLEQFSVSITIRLTLISLASETLKMLRLKSMTHKRERTKHFLADFECVITLFLL